MNAAPEVSLIDNSERTLQQALSAALSDARQANIAVAFLKMSGLRLIEPALDHLLARDGRAEFLVGLDFHTTEAEALKALISKGCRLICFSTLHDSGVVYHPKLYLFAGDQTAAAIIGSANLTAGGLQTNIEINLQIRFPDRQHELARLLFDTYATLRADRRCFVPDEDYLKAYDDLSREIARRRREDEKALRREIEALQTAESALPRPPVHLSDLSGWQRLVWEKLPEGTFQPADLYRHVPEFRAVYPSNHNPEAKIRQVLQQLRDLGFVEQLRRGQWRKKHHHTQE